MRRKPKPPSAPKQSRRFAPALALAFAALGFALYAPALQFDFLNWDDPNYVLQNPRIKSADAANLRRIITQPYDAHYAPLHLLSYALDYALWGEAADTGSTAPAGAARARLAFGFHLSNILLHALACALAFLAVRRLSGSAATGAATAFLFALHPSHIAAVAWISSRKDLLMLAFALAALHFYLQAKARGGLWRQALSLLCFVLCALSKSTLLLLPVFLWLVELAEMLRGRARRNRLPNWPNWRALIAPLPRLAPFFAAALAVAFINLGAQIADTRTTGLDYVLLKGQAHLNYWGLLSGVLEGRPLYDKPELELISLHSFASLAGIAAPFIVMLFAWRKGRRTLFLGVAWIVLALAPALLFPVITYMADRYLYAPSLGFCWLLGAGIMALFHGVHNYLQTRPKRRRQIAAAAAALLLALPAALFTWRLADYLPAWRDSAAFWQRAGKHSTDARFFNNLAFDHIQKQQWREAEELLTTAAPAGNPNTFRNLGVVYYNQGRYQEALQQYALALEALEQKAPGDLNYRNRLRAEIQNNRAAILWRRGDYAACVQLWEEALRLWPEYDQAKEWLPRARAALQQQRGGNTDLP